MAATGVPQPDVFRPRSVTVGDVLALPSAAGARVVAGHRGMNRPVRWVHISELLDIARLLNGGEFLLTTGMGFRDAGPAELQAYVASLAEAGVAALGLELVQWFTEPPAALVDACERHGLPLVTWRSEVRFRQIAEEVTRRLLEGPRGEGPRGPRGDGGDPSPVSGPGEEELAELLLSGSWAEPLARAQLAAAGLVAGPWLSVGVVQTAGSASGSPWLQQITQAFPRATAGRAAAAVARLACGVRGPMAVVILTGPSPAALRQAWDGLLPRLRQTPPGAGAARPATPEPPQVGVGRPRESLGQLGGAFREALAVLRFQSRRRPWPHIHFDQLQLGQILLSLPEPALQRLVEAELGALLKVPRPERRELWHTLSVLLEENFNVSAAAKALHLRRQSLYRRLARLEELLGPDLERCDRRATLLLALRGAQLLGLDPEG